MKMKIALVLIALSALTLSAESNITFTMKLTGSKTSFFVGEPIYVTILIKNNTDKAVKYMPDKHGAYELRNERGEVVNVPWFITTAQQTLMGQQELTYVINLSDYYYMGTGNDLPSGKNVITKYIELSSNINSYKRIASNSIEIEIVEPIGDEAIAYRLFKKSMQLGISKGFTEEGMQLYAKIFNDYPHSVYAAESKIKWIFGTSFINKDDGSWQADELYKFIIGNQNHPKLIDHINSITVALRNAKKDKEIPQKLNSLKTLTNRNDVRKEIERILKSIKE